MTKQHLKTYTVIILAFIVSIGYANYQYYDDYYQTNLPRKGILERVGKALSTGVSRVSRQFQQISRQTLDGNAFIPVALAVALIGIRVLMDIATASAGTPGPRGLTGATGATGPQGAPPNPLFCSGGVPTCFSETPTCAATGNTPSCGAGPDCSTSGIRRLTDGSTTVLPGAQVPCTCNSAGAIQPCNQPACTQIGGPTCANGANAICSGFDSNTAAPLQLPICATSLPQDHLNIALANPPNPNVCTAVGGQVPPCPPLAPPNMCGGGTTTCTRGALTCDNVRGGQPVCSLRPGTGIIPAAATVCTNPANILLNCPSCTASTVMCTGGTFVTCSNYDSTSTIIPAPWCQTAAPANVPNTGSTGIQNGNTQCLADGTPSCLPLAAPACGLGMPVVATDAGCAIGTLTCSGRNPGEGPICSLGANVIPLNGVNKCANNQINFACGTIFVPNCPMATSGTATCPMGTILTCSGRNPGQSQICSTQAGITAVGPGPNGNGATACSNFVPPVC